MANENTNEIPALATLLGSNVKEWPYSEEALIIAMKLRSQQEQTKRQYYQLECSKNSLQILNSAIEAGIPPQLIPQLFYRVETDQQGRHYETSIREGRKNSMSQYRFPACDVSSRVPKDFELKTHRRTESPARIGAEAVASLNNNVSLREEDSSNSKGAIPSPPHTQRRMNLMPVSKNEPTKGVLNFATWHPYSSQTHNNGNIKKPSLTFNKKHRRTKSTDSAFGVLDLTAPNETSYNDFNSKQDTKLEEYKRLSVNNGTMLESIKQKQEKILVENTNVGTTSSISSGKGPNFKDNLLN